MIRYLLDTNICIALIKRNPPEAIQRLRKARVSEVGVSSITLSELEYGVEKSARQEQNRLALLEFLAPLEVLPYDDRAAREYGRVRVHLERAGRLIGALDLLIGAHALSLGSTLVTSNVREFCRIPSLDVVDWSSP